MNKLLIKEQVNHQICPAGNWNAVCVAVYDLGVQPSMNGWREKRKVALVFEIDQKIKDGPLKGQPYRISKIVSVSFHKKSTLMQTLISWFGSDPSIQQGNTRVFDLESLVGKPCTLTVVHKSREGETRADVTAVSSHMEGQPVLSSTYDPAETPPWVERMQAERLDEDAAPVTDHDKSNVQHSALENPEQESNEEYNIF